MRSIYSVHSLAAMFVATVAGVIPPVGGWAQKALSSIPAGSSTFEDLTITEALERLAQDHKELCFVVEGWQETQIPFVREYLDPNLPVPATEFAFADNPSVTLVDLNAAGKSLDVVLNELAIQHGGSTWTYDPQYRVVNFIFAGISALGASWPLASPVTYSNPRLAASTTASEAQRRLVAEFGYSTTGVFRQLEPGIPLMTVEDCGCPQTVVVPPEGRAPRTPRGLFNSLVRTVGAPGVWLVQPSTPVDPRIGVLEVGGSQPIEWSGMYKGLLDDISVPGVRASRQRRAGLAAPPPPNPNGGLAKVSVAVEPGTVGTRVIEAAPGEHVTTFDEMVPIPPPAPEEP